MLDLGTRIAAPFCAGQLGELGATVIKVEQPGTGDFMREIGPFEDGRADVPVLERAGPEVLADDIGPRRQPPEQFLAFGSP